MRKLNVWFDREKKEDSLVFFGVIPFLLIPLLLVGRYKLGGLVLCLIALWPLVTLFHEPYGNWKRVPLITASRTRLEAWLPLLLLTWGLQSFVASFFLVNSVNGQVQSYDLMLSAIMNNWLYDSVPAVNAPLRNHSFSQVSVILPCLNEHEYINRTIASILTQTADNALKEIIIVDDWNEKPIADVIDPRFLRSSKIKVIVNKEREGLIRSKQVGGDIAQGAYLIFLDAHTKPYKHYLHYILRDLQTNPTRIVVPAIPILNGSTWEQQGDAIGYKMMFSWDLRFHWVYDDNDEVPLMSGGLLAITKEFWRYTGGFDTGMRVWGGENVEQSIKAWMSGGEIVVSRKAEIAHVFRPSFPYPVDSVKVATNKLRTARVWFDEWAQVVGMHVRPHYSTSERFQNIGDLNHPIHNRRKLAGSREFSWYIDRFRPRLYREDMIILPEFVISYGEKCLRPDERGELRIDVCGDPKSDAWLVEGYRLEDVFDGSNCDASAVCRRVSGFLRHTESQFCFGEQSTLTQPIAKLSTLGYDLILTKECGRRRGSYRDITTFSGFIPVNATISAVPREWEDFAAEVKADEINLFQNIIWRKVYPKIVQSKSEDVGQVNFTRSFPSTWSGRLEWGSQCIGRVDNDVRVLKCSPLDPRQRWNLTFVNEPHRFWTIRTENRTTNAH